MTARASDVSGEGQEFVETLDVPFMSFCAHHFLPFFGTIDVIYIPGALRLGLGKITRLVACRAQRLQVQETLVREIAQDLFEHGQATGAEVVATARHTCICYRGPGATPVTNRTTFTIGDLRRPSVSFQTT